MSDKLSDKYRTPKKDFWDVLNEVTPFFWDACCDENNCLNDNQKEFDIMRMNEYDYLTFNIKEFVDSVQEANSDYFPNGAESIFINPPYSNVKPFIEKAWSDAKHFRVVMLLKADMSTDWFNNIMDEMDDEIDNIPYQLIQGRYTLKDQYMTLLEEMKTNKTHAGILHLRKRVKFLADEEMMTEDYYNDHPISDKLAESILESKNFKRGKDGLIYPKSGPTFPSMIVVLDRRGG